MTNEEVAIKLTEHDNRIKVAEKHIDSLEETQKQIQDLTYSVKEMAISMKQMLEELTKQGERIKVLEDAPAKRWKDSTKALFNAMLGSIGTAIAAMLLWGIAGFMRSYLGG